ncbi:hypothetical protein [Cryobacterium sp. 10C3]|uniref:hypothetical protein n=1 Tax=Cryobacterium sp. 10C3 TaxID=3048577 RepID=UPI002AB539A5|nr:hypothetical protein [Cryobacterium sp. 10C3]MDY7556478.1 hypothetical protein [Cryobacterium sp. 10C3]
MSAMDLATLRRLAAEGNEEAANRLAELAATRGDLAELRELVDSGNELAGEKLAQLAGSAATSTSCAVWSARETNWRQTSWPSSPRRGRTSTNSAVSPTRATRLLRHS